MISNLPQSCFKIHTGSFNIPIPMFPKNVAIAMSITNRKIIIKFVFMKKDNSK